MGQAYAGFMKGVTRNAQRNPGGKVRGECGRGIMIRRDIDGRVLHIGICPSMLAIQPLPYTNFQ